MIKNRDANTLAPNNKEPIITTTYTKPVIVRNRKLFNVFTFRDYSLCFFKIVGMNIKFNFTS